MHSVRSELVQRNVEHTTPTRRHHIPSWKIKYVSVSHYVLSRGFQYMKVTKNGYSLVVYFGFMDVNLR